MRTGPLEITDLMWSFDASGARQAVARDDVVTVLRERGQSRAARIVSALPVTGSGDLDPDTVDALGLRIHFELQRLGEELQLWRRTAALVSELLDDLGPDPVRLVDIGCGTGHVLRSIALRRALPSNLELVGVDLNAVLVAEAQRLAHAERLSCRFVTGDAFASDGAIENGPRTIVISTGVLHHLSEADLGAFFAAHAAHRVAAFAHWDIAPCLWSTLGAWTFHQARMREPVSRHDGVLSARRAHPATVLEAAARAGAPSYDAAVRTGPRWQPRALDVLRPLVGIGRP